MVEQAPVILLMASFELSLTSKQPSVEFIIIAIVRVSRELYQTQELHLNSN